ncbi:MAG: gamma carbonic anhydrase family protein [Gammaproteobacteria bacterium]|nr:gamma carbonic anhydrase family protein [Gammaproteobacteria bacterium]
MTVRTYNNISPEIAAGVFVDEQAAVIGDVTIGEDSSIWPMVAIRGDVHSISIGKRTNIQDGSVLHVTADNEFNPGGHPLIIGDEVTVGHGAILHACTVGDRSLIGMGATVLDGAVIESHVMVAAGTLVPPGKILESGYLYMGNPVKQARPLKEKEIEYFSFSAQHYVNLKDKHLNNA